MSNNEKKMRIKWWHIVLIAVLVVLFLALAYWQWTRFQSGSGSFQNLGYALQWPLFAAFVVYAYRTTLHYENLGEEQPAKSPEATKIDEDFLPQRPQIDVETYNSMVQPRRGGHLDQQDARGDAKTHGSSAETAD